MFTFCSNIISFLNKENKESVWKHNQGDLCSALLYWPADSLSLNIMEKSFTARLSVTWRVVHVFSTDTQILVHTEHSCSVWATVILSGWNGVQRLHSCSLCCSVTDGAISPWNGSTVHPPPGLYVRLFSETHLMIIVLQADRTTLTWTFPLHPALPAVGVAGRTELVVIMWTGASGPVTGVRKQPGCLQQSREKSWPELPADWQLADSHTHSGWRQRATVG